jgi:hypothetical protein
LEQGRTEGLEKGLLKLIELKFGKPSAQVIESIQAATSEQLEKMMEQILTVASLEELLGQDDQGPRP